VSVTRTVNRGTDRAYASYRSDRIAHWDSVATNPLPRDGSGYYADLLRARYRFLIPPGLHVLEVGSGDGELLAAVEPSRGLGIDFSAEMVAAARTRHPSLEFAVGDAHDFDIDETFDVVILSDLVNDVWDVQAVLEQVRRVCEPHTRIILNFYNRAWQGPLEVARMAGLAKPNKAQNWLSPTDVANLLELAGFQLVTLSREVLAPVDLGPVSALLNRFIVKFWPFDHAALTTFVVARPQPADRFSGIEPSASVIVPARNEAGNIEDIIRRTPQMGSGTQLIFVEGNSTDDTYETIDRILTELDLPHAELLRQPGKGKGDAVRYGFAHATGDVLMILDADMTVAPEELPRFFRIIADGTGEFVNGVRLVYPMEGEAMRFLNYLGNKFFSLAFSWLLRQPVKDTLCGTKVLTRESYDRIAANRAYFGAFDPFGDFDLLFGAAKLNLKIVDLPIRYRDRTYGSTNIDRWRHGMLLLRMVAFAARKLRFV
jgi:SAM-dependent methyltransferase